MKLNRRYIELIRVSTQGQADRDTPKDQRDALDKLRQSRPGVLVARIDEAISGAKGNDERSDIQRLFDLAARRAFDEVRVRHIDRLTRHKDARERFAIYGAIQDAGAIIVEASGREIDPADEMGELDLSLQGWFAARERRRIIDRTSAAKKRKAAEGRLVQGQAPYGRTFDKVTGKWGIEETEAENFRRMYDLCLSGRSLLQIAEALNDAGAVTPRGCRFTDVTVSRLLRNPAAYGPYTATSSKRKDGTREGAVTFEIPAVVDEATYRAAVARLKSNNSLSGPRTKVFALLRKLGTCGECNSIFHTQRGGGASKILYYLCADPTCGIRHRVEDVDAAVIARLVKWIDDPAALTKAAGRGAPKSLREQALSEAERAEVDLKRLERQETNTARLLTKGAITQKVGLGLLAEVAKGREDAEVRLGRAKALLANSTKEAQRVEQAEVAIARLRTGLRSRTPERWRELVQVVFPRGGVAVHRDGTIELVGRVRAEDGARNLPRAS